ncbi:hypothetical protein T484DRAFT_2027909 [Baffinella frigidus]|nr:hypothetical protein T484DRAFT_2027909 [Cryptophyta sp. CCMP2293]
MLYQGQLYSLLFLKFNSIEEKIGVLQDLGDECGEALLKTLLKWSGSASLRSEKVMDKALKLVDEANKATTLKELDRVAAAMVVLNTYIHPDQRAGIDELLAATLTKVMRVPEVMMRVACPTLFLQNRQGYTLAFLKPVALRSIENFSLSLLPSFYLPLPCPR